MSSSPPKAREVLAFPLYLVVLVLYALAAGVGALADALAGFPRAKRWPSQ